MFSPRTCCLLISLIFVVSKCNGEGYPPASTCARLECPKYTVVHSQKEFEIRNYTKATWVSGPTITSTSYKAASNEGFLKLAAYFNRGNREKMKVEMTAPVLVGIENSNYTVYFYLPKEYQIYKPRPLTDDIRPIDLPPRNIKYAAVRRFGGFIGDADIPEQMDALKNSLKSTPYERAAAHGVFMVAGYNSPFDFFGRVNEAFIWF